MKKMSMLVLVLLAGYGLVSCKGAEVKTAAQIGESYVLDKANSSLQATVMKNESVAVPVKFPSLEGSLALDPLKASLTIGIADLDTGNPDRNKNITTLFFEVASIMNQKATFELSKLDKDAASLVEGKSVDAKGEGVLSLHGNKVSLSGPLTLSKTAHGYVASFKDAWTVNIKEAGMLPELANLSDSCPQPHRVGLDVKLSGTLAFVKR